MPRVVHFEIYADDVERCVRFYQDVFGWNMQKWQGPMEYWLAITGREGEPGIDGGIVKRQGPDVTTVNTVNVDSLDDYVNKVGAAGGQVVVPRMAIPGVGWLCYFRDPEGNLMGIMQSDEQAK